MHCIHKGFDLLDQLGAKKGSIILLFNTNRYIIYESFASRRNFQELLQIFSILQIYKFYKFTSLPLKSRLLI